MYKNQIFIKVIIFFVGVMLSSSAFSWERGKVETFTLLPESSSNPEALTIRDNGDIYVSTFGTGEIHHYSPKGNLINSITVSPSSGLLTELAFHPTSGALLVIDMGGKTVLDVDVESGNATVFAEIPGTENATPNVLTFDEQGYVYISDSTQGTIWRTDPDGAQIEAWVTHDLLRANGYPPFGANGIAFNNNHSALFVANTGEDTIVRIPVDQNGRALTPEILTNSINGPDGIVIDAHDNIWIAANQSNEIVIIDSSGNGVAVLGDFNGITHEGIVDGLLLPSDLALSGKYVYVTNFALDLTSFGLAQHYSTIWARQVTQHSIARIKVKLSDFDHE